MATTICAIAFIVASVAILLYGLYRDLVSEPKATKKRYEEAIKANPPYFCHQNGWGFGTDTDPHLSLPAPPVEVAPYGNAPRSSGGMTGGWTW